MTDKTICEERLNLKPKEMCDASMSFLLLYLPNGEVGQHFCALSTLLIITVNSAWRTMAYSFTQRRSKFV